MGFLGARARDVAWITAGWRTDEVNWALKMVPDKAKRVVETFELDAALRIERVAAVRKNMAGK